jgi:hypothetical protein
MVKKDLQVGDLIKILKITEDGNRAGYVDEMHDHVGKTGVIKDFAGDCPGISSIGWMDDVLFFDPRDVRRIRKAKPVAKPVADMPYPNPASNKALLDKLIKQCKEEGGVGLCSFARKLSDEREIIDVCAPCHARLMYNNNRVGVEVVALAMYDYLERSFHKEAYKLHVKYIIQDSPWAHLFNEKDIDAILKSGVTLNTDVPCNNVVGACVALREGNEFPRHLDIFKEVIDAGFSGHTAYVVSRGFDGTMKEPRFVGVSNAHKVLSPDQSVDCLAKFFIKGYSNGATSYKKGDYQYGIAAFIAPEKRPTIDSFLESAVKNDIVNGPFGLEKKPVTTTESLLDVCKRFEDKLNEWRKK